VATYALRVSRWYFQPLSADEGGLYIIQGRQPHIDLDEDDWHYSWRFIMPPPSPATTVLLWHALTHIFRRLGMPGHLELPFSPYAIDPWEYTVIMSLVLYDWHRPPPTISYSHNPRPPLPIHHSRTLGAAMDRDARQGVTSYGRPFAACFPPGYLTDMAALPGPPIPPPFHPAMAFTAWLRVDFQGTAEEVEYGTAW
jgi:hypothetical protein